MAVSLARPATWTPGSWTFRRVWRRMRGGGALAAAFLGLAVLLGLVPWLVTRQNPIEMAPETILTPPGAAHIFGTDQFGRDIFTRAVYGARFSLGFAFLATIVSLSVSTLLGILTGFHGGRVDNAIMRVVDVLMAFPGILLALAIVSILGPGLGTAMIAVGVGQSPGYTRIIRSAVLTVRGTLYIEAARALGAGDALVLRRHILPNIVHSVLVLGTLGFGAAILIGSSLSFLGLGAQPPTPEWGSMLSDARGYVRTHWWVPTFPGAVLAATLLAINIVGDMLRDALDPRLRLD